MKEYKVVYDALEAVNLPLIEENGQILLSRDSRVMSEQSTHLGRCCMCSVVCKCCFYLLGNKVWNVDTHTSKE